MQVCKCANVQTSISVAQLFEELLPLSISQTEEIFPMNDSKCDSNAGPR